MRVLPVLLVMPRLLPVLPVLPRVLDHSNIALIGCCPSQDLSVYSWLDCEPDDLYKLRMYHLHEVQDSFPHPIPDYLDYWRQNGPLMQYLSPVLSALGGFSFTARPMQVSCPLPACVWSDVPHLCGYSACLFWHFVSILCGTTSSQNGVMLCMCSCSCCAVVCRVVVCYIYILHVTSSATSSSSIVRALYAMYAKVCHVCACFRCEHANLWQCAEANIDSPANIKQRMTSSQHACLMQPL